MGVLACEAYFVTIVSGSCLYGSAGEKCARMYVLEDILVLICW